MIPAKPRGSGGASAQSGADVDVGGPSKINGNAAMILADVIDALIQTVKMNGTGAFGRSNSLMPLSADNGLDQRKCHSPD